jgi:hypothetical protein
VDSNGARLLAARIRAGVRVGARIELVSVEDRASELVVGDRGIVESIADTGDVVVTWDRGFELEIDPDVHRYRRLAA